MRCKSNVVVGHLISTPTNAHTKQVEALVLQPAKRTLPNIIRYKPQHTTITEQGNDVVKRHYSRKLLKMDILMFETC